MYIITCNGQYVGASRNSAFVGDLIATHSEGMGLKFFGYVGDAEVFQGKDGKYVYEIVQVADYPGPFALYNGRVYPLYAMRGVSLMDYTVDVAFEDFMASR